MAIAESREFFLRHNEVNEGAFRDIEAHFPLTTYVKELKVADDGTLSVETVLRYNRFLETDRPTPQVIEKLLSSICFKLNPSDSASETQPGFVKLATVEQMIQGITIDQFGYTLIYSPAFLTNKEDISDLNKKLDDLNDKIDPLDKRISDLENAEPKPDYELPIASETELGGVKIDNKTIVINNGVISAKTEIPLFKSPDGFIRITNEIGDVSNDNFPNITDLDTFNATELISKMLFPIPKPPIFIPPSILFTIDGDVSLVENGSDITLGLNTTFIDSNNTSIMTANSLQYKANGVVFEKGTPMLITNVTEIKSSCVYESNPTYSYLSGDGVILKSSDFKGYPTNASNRILSSSKIVTPINPIWVGCLNDVSNPDSILVNDLVTLLTSKKILALTYTLVDLPIISYIGTYDTSKIIVCITPILLKSITYSQNMNVDLLAAGVFTKRLNQMYSLQNGATTLMHIYYANNPYNANEVVNYVFNF